MPAHQVQEDEEGVTEDDCCDEEYKQCKHILEIGCGETVKGSVLTRYVKKLTRKQLTEKGVYVVTQERQGRSSKSKHRPGRSRSHAGSGSGVIYGYNNHNLLSNSILTHNLTDVTLKDGITKVRIPLFLKSACDFIRQDLDTEGIFRKSGAAQRKQRIMQDLLKIRKKEDVTKLFLPIDSVYDACSALTQILRNLETPLIPFQLHGIFQSCLQLQPKKSCVEGLLESICLLPPQNISILSYFIQFLQEVAHHSSKNLMVTTNLGVVMVENLMPAVAREEVSDASLKTPSSSLNTKEKIEQHSRIIEILIEYADQVGYLTPALQQLVEENPLSHFEISSSDEDDGNDSSPSKKRRSGSLTRIMGIFRKANKPAKTVLDSISIETKTPVGFSVTGHTPIIKEGSKKFGNRTDRLNSASNSVAKKQLLDVVRKNELALPVTPYIGYHCTSPFVSLHPSPKFPTDVHTPLGPKRKNFMTSNLLKKRLKTTPDVNAKESSSVFANADLTDSSATPQLELVSLEGSPRKPKELSKSGIATGIAKSPRPRPHSFHSPHTTPSSESSAMQRSPSTRRTIRRGRPNTLRVGLTRPSPPNNVVKIESSPQSSSSRLLRSSSSVHVFKKETFMFSSDNTSPRKKVTIEPSGRVVSRHSSGRPALEIPKPPPIPELKINDNEKVDADNNYMGFDKPTQCTNVRASPAIRMNTSISVTHFKSPTLAKKQALSAPRSQSMRDSTRSYIPRPTRPAGNISQVKPMSTILTEEPEEQLTPNCPQKSASTSTMTPLRRRNSVVELIKLYETNGITSASTSQLENRKPKPYTRTRTLDRNKLEPYDNRFTKFQPTNPLIK